ncbi:MAG: hypothetical protein ACRCUT_09380, partial [Spirochaetota bacterium]
MELFLKKSFFCAAVFFPLSIVSGCASAAGTAGEQKKDRICCVNLEAAVDHELAGDDEWAEIKSKKAVLSSRMRQGGEALPDEERQVL